MTSDHITKEDIEVKVGQVWRDLDKRMYSGNRHCKVMSVADGKALMKLCNSNGFVISERHVKVSVRRMHKGSTGWALVTDVTNSERPDGIRPGDEVVLVRGSRGRGPESGPGYERQVRARYLGGQNGMVQCELLEDDPNAGTAPFKAGEVGWWHGESFIRPVAT